MTPTDIDAAFMHRAIGLAMRGRGTVEPNPMVGCVIVKNESVIGEGWHQNFGGPHAEPNAVANCTEPPAGATAYVTLEPCCHTNKQTPPCVPKLIAANLARVVVGCADPNPEVAGKGIAQLRAAGLTVDTGICEPQARQLIAAFFARMILRRPYVTLKWAQTTDGKIAGPGGRRLQISNPASTVAVQKLRAYGGAILVGINTVLADDPLLTVRDVAPLQPLLRIVLDRNLRIPLTSRLVQSPETPLLIFTSFQAAERNNEKLERLRALGIRCEAVEGIPDALAELGALGITHVTVEPGPTLARAFFDAGLVDRVWMIRSPNRLDDASAPAAAGVREGYVVTRQINLDGDLFTEYLNPKSPAFFAAEPSAEMRDLR